MAEIFTIQGLSISIYPLDAGPAHLHVRRGNDEFVMTLDGREVEGRGTFEDISVVNDFIDSCDEDVHELGQCAQRGEKITRLNVKNDE